MGLINLYVAEKTQKQSHEKHGVRIGNVGIDFERIKDREQFLNLLSRASSVIINDNSGIVHKEQQVSFGIYNREIGKIGVRCHKCETVFYAGECRSREYEYPYSYKTNGLSTETRFICDACLASISKQVAEIKKQNLEEKEKLGVE